MNCDWLTQSFTGDAKYARATAARITVAIFAVFIFAGLAAQSSAWSAEKSWREEKCARYKKDWDRTLAGRSTNGLSPQFLNAHDEFLKSGCETPAYVCPQSAAEFALANIMVVHAMNAGTASTFLPFACRR